MNSGERNCWRVLHRGIAEEIRLREQQTRTPVNQEVVKGLILGTMILLLLTLVVTISYSPVWLLLWGSIGVATFLLIVNCAHDASHRVLFKSAHANSCALLLPFALLGIDGALWGLRHRGAHHPHTNVSGEDTDSVPNPFLRLSPHHPWRPRFAFQHLYAPFLYALALPHTALVQDFEHLLFRPLPYLKKIRSFPTAWARLIAIKLFYCLLFIGLPIFLGGHTLPHVLLGVVLQQVAASLVFVFTICLNHYVCETTFFEAHPQQTHLEHQLVSSADWFPTNRFWCWIMGGANAHTAHHLFPGVSHRHYWWISKRISDFCRENNLPYNSFSFREGLRSHFRFLIKLGKEGAK